MRHTRLLLTLIAALGGACGGRPSQVAPVALMPCAVPGVGTPDSVWHQVRASGFTFCVPVSWQPSGHAHDSTDAQHWKGENGLVVRWGLGRPPLPIVVGYEVTGTVSRPGTVFRGGAAPPLPMPRHQFQCSRPLQSNTPLTVDGGSLVVTQVLCQSTWTMTAWSTAPAIYVQGEAHSAQDADVLLTVLQTIRFPTPPR